ncbi:MAG: transglycosylase domain-containing protein [Candidatus Dojkabacteria bacterium]
MRSKIDKFLLRIKTILYLIPLIAICLVLIYSSFQYLRFDPKSIEFATSSIKVFDKNSSLLWEVSKDNAVKTTPIKIKDVPSNCVNGLVSVEDRYFWNNIGIDLNGLGRLGISVFTGDYAGGGSTITQQLIKVANERIYSRNPVDKLNEIVSAIKLNTTLSKSEILEMYLNNVFFGNLNYGIESASQDYFKKSVKDLDLAQCSYLAGVPQWPGVLNPYGDLDKAKARQKIVLSSMVRDGYITQEESDQAITEDLAFNSTPLEVKAPHYVQFVSDLIQKKVLPTQNLQGFSNLDLGKSAEIYSTYDYTLHKKSLEISQNVITSLKDRNINNSAVVILGKNNELLTMIGSSNYFNDTIDGKFNSALGFRQPGTALIPYLYSYAFTKDKSPNTSLPNMPFSTVIDRGDKKETVQIANFNNYQSTSENLLDSLTNAYVIPSVELTQSLTKEKVEDNFNEFETLSLTDRPKCSDASVMEGCEKDLLDLTFFYSVLKDGGLKTQINTVRSIKKYDDTAKIIIPASSSTSNIQIGTTLVKNLIPLDSNGWRIYNGDTSNFKDTFTFAYNDSFTIGIWAGNTKGDPTSSIKASESTEIIFNQISEYIKSLN